MVLSVDVNDTRYPEKYEKFLRPVLERLKRVEGNGGLAPLSIMACKIEPLDARLQAFLKEGLSLEAHAAGEPCPLLAGGDFKKAKATFDECVDALSLVPGGKPVAFRTPCCDAKNAVSPRFFAGIFNDKEDAFNALAIDSSVFHFFTPDDPDLPRDLVTTKEGTGRFRRYCAVPVVRQRHRRLPVPLRRQPPLLGIPLLGPRRLAVSPPPRRRKPAAVGRLESRARRDGSEARGDDPRPPPRRLVRAAAVD